MSDTWPPGRRSGSTSAEMAKISAPYLGIKTTMAIEFESAVGQVLNVSLKRSSFTIADLCGFMCVFQILK
jgi:hypothetical protein